MRELKQQKGGGKDASSDLIKTPKKIEDEDEDEYDSQPNLERIVQRNIKNRYEPKAWWKQFRYIKNLNCTYDVLYFIRNLVLGIILVVGSLFLMELLSLESVFGIEIPEKLYFAQASTR